MDRHDPTGRKADMAELQSMYSQARTAKERAEIRETANKIRHQSPLVKDMRAALIKAKREGNVAEMRNIHEDVRRHSKYRE